MDVRPTAVDRTQGYEGWVPFFYLDTVGLVTVGYGRMLATPDLATSVSMQSGGAAATDAQKRNEWTMMKGKEPGRIPEYYKKFATLSLDKGVARGYLIDELKEAIGYLAKAFPNLDSYPAGPQDALLDMMFNMGAGEFGPAHWPSLFAAVKKKAWTTAAKQSTRHGIGDDRNKAIYDLFMSGTTGTS